jgi:hypothetical protein
MTRPMIHSDAGETRVSNLLDPVTPRYPVGTYVRVRPEHVFSLEHVGVDTPLTQPEARDAKPVDPQPTVAAQADMPTISETETMSILRTHDRDTPDLDDLRANLDDLRTELSRKEQHLVQKDAALVEERAHVERLRGILDGVRATNGHLRSRVEREQRQVEDKCAVMTRLINANRALRLDAELHAFAIETLTAERDQYRRLYEDRVGKVWKIACTLSDVASAGASVTAWTARSALSAPASILRRGAAVARQQVRDTRWVAASVLGTWCALVGVGMPYVAARAYLEYVPQARTRFMPDPPVAANPADPRERAWIAAREAARRG